MPYRTKTLKPGKSSPFLTLLNEDSRYLLLSLKYCDPKPRQIKMARRAGQRVDPVNIGSEMTRS